MNPLGSAIASHWRRKPMQLFVLIVGLALATGLWTAVQAINGEARKSYAEAAGVLDQDQLDRLEAVNGNGISRSRFAEIRRAGLLVSPVVEGRVELGGTALRVIGIDPLTAPTAGAEMTFSSEGGLAEFLGGGTLLVSPETAAKISDDRYRTSPQDNIAPGLAMTDLTTAWDLLGTTRISYFTLNPVQPLGIPSVAEIAPDLRRVSPTEPPDVAQLTDSFHLNLTAFGLLAFGVGLFIVNAALGLAFEQRRGMFRTLRALGVSARALITALALETGLLALCAGALGVGLGYLIAAALLPDVAATLRGLYGADVAGTLRLDPYWVVSGFAVAGLGALAAAAQSLWQVSRLPILASAQPRAWAMESSRSTRLMAYAAIALAGLAVGVAFLGSGLISGFIILGAMLLSAALVLPWVLGALLLFAGRLVRGPRAEWIWADTRQQIPGMSLALMALLLALAANIGVGTMVDSFRLTFVGWLDQRLASELYVTAQNEDQAEDLLQFLNERADAVLPVRSTEAQLLGAPGEIFGVIDDATYRQAWPLIKANDAPWEAIANGAGVLVNEQLYRRNDLHIGQGLALAQGWELPVVGVYSDYGNPLGQAIVRQSDLMARYPEVPKLLHAVRIDPQEAPALAAALADEVGIPPQNILNQAEVKQFSIAVFDRTFLVTGALNILTLGVAAFAMLASLLTLANMRLPQLAPVWALGMTRRQLAATELARATLFAVLTWIVAIPVGLLLSWILLAVVNVEAFGWRLPMHVFPLDWIWLLFWAVCASILAAGYPVWRLSRVPAAELLKVFTHER